MMRGYGSNGIMAPTQTMTSMRPMGPALPILPPVLLDPGLRARLRQNLMQAVASSGVASAAAAAEAAPASKGNKVLGAVLTGAGVIGGSALLIKGGALSTGVKVLAGAAALGAVGGGVALMVTKTSEEKQKQQALDGYTRMEDLLESKVAPGQVGPQDGNLLADFDTTSHPFYKVKARPHWSIASSMDVLCKDVPESLFRGGIANTARAPIPQIHGLTLEPQHVPSVYGHPVWVEVGHVRARGRNVTICPPTGCADAITGKEVWVDVYHTSGDKICKIKCNRYKGDWNWGYFPGLFPARQRECGGCTHTSDNKDFVTWEPSFQNWEGTGAPPRGFYMRGSSNAWLDQATTMLASPQNDLLSGQPDNIRGPMGAIMQAYRSLRAASPEVVMMYIPDPWAMFHLVAATARMYDARAWWAKVGDWMGTVLGVASFVCEVVTPVISCINPAFGATIGLAMSTAVRAGKTITAMVQGNPAGVFDIMAEIGMGARDLQIALGEGYARVTNFYDEVGAMVDGWLNMKGMYAGDLGDLAMEAGQAFTDVLNPAQQFKMMVNQIYSASSSQIGDMINFDMNVPFWIQKVQSLTNKVPGPEDIAFPMPAPGEFISVPKV